MRFKRASVRYSNTPQPETPYQAAAQVWDDRIGSARVQAKNWRMMAFANIGFSFLMAGAIGWLATRSSIVPYVIEINREGDARSVGPALEHYQASDAQIAHQLSRFIRDIRSIPLDPVVLRENWFEAYRYVTAHGAMFLNDYARSTDPFARVGRETIAIEPTSVVRVSTSSFQIRWSERVYLNGSLSSTQHWTAILSTVARPPRDEDSLRGNPLGIYVDGLDWSRELDSGDTK